MLTAAGMVLCVIQFAFFVYMILMFMEMDFAEGFKFMLLAYSSAFVYKNMENSGSDPANNTKLMAVWIFPDPHLLYLICSVSYLTYFYSFFDFFSFNHSYFTF